MNKNKSSFHMGGVMQGYGQPIILKADPVTLTPVSQENVRLTPNFNKHLLKIIFSIPAVWDPANLDPAMMKIMGALAAVNQVIFPETPGDGAGQTPALDFRLASRHAGSGGELAVVTAFGKKSKDEKKKKGKWKKDWGKKYYYDPDGEMVKGEFRKIDGEWYYFHEDGHMATGGQVINGENYYFGSDGRLEEDQPWKKNGQGGSDFYGDEPETYKINDFIFNSTQEEKKADQALANALMLSHQLYHGYITRAEYVTKGSILACTNGTRLTRLDATSAVDICDMGTGLPVMGCADCKAGENIHSFYGCYAAEIVGMPMRETVEGGYKKCIPLMNKEWVQEASGPILWNSVSGECFLALREDSLIICKYGGRIGIVEIPEKREDASQYVTLEQLDQFHFFMGFTDAERKAGVAELNRALEKYEITTDIRISFFMGQVKHESRSGARTLEQFNGDSPEEWFNSQYSYRSNIGNKGGNDGEHFRGAGYIHLTGRYNYEEFAKDMEDPEIVTQGYRVVGGVYNRPVHEIRTEDLGVIDLGEYVWEASGWYWRHGAGDDLNTLSDERKGFKISYNINKDDKSTFSARNDYVKEFYRILTSGELEISDTEESLYENIDNN